MSRRSLQVFDRYPFGPRSVLVPGDRFRVSGGPFYVTDDGRKIPLADRGMFVFRRYCVQGAARWIEAHRADGGLAILWVGKPGHSPAVPNLRRRPYRVCGKLRDPRALRMKRNTICKCWTRKDLRVHLIFPHPCCPGFVQRQLPAAEHGAAQVDAGGFSCRRLHG